jgi:2-keto-4-pentenoate hydratase/2-oxohepta-3-ene-1,7-dioic acid hydratase in catechol pathway
VDGSRRIGRFEERGRIFHALLEGEDGVLEIEGDPFGAWRPVGSGRPRAGLRVLPPCTPSKIIGIGRNYRAHAAELGHDLPPEPLLFLKPPSAALASGETIRLPRESARVDYEGEIGVVIGRVTRRVTRERALDHVLGYTCVNDVTARDLQARDVQFTRAKGFDTFCPFGPVIALGPPPASLSVETFVNGERRQTGRAGDMIFDVPALVSAISRVMTLLPGDLIATGTPEGVGPLQPGDEVSVVVGPVGRLSNRVEAVED